MLIHYESTFCYKSIPGVIGQHVTNTACENDERKDLPIAREHALTSLTWKYQFCVAHAKIGSCSHWAFFHVRYMNLELN